MECKKFDALLCFCFSLKISIIFSHIQNIQNCIWHYFYSCKNSIQSFTKQYVEFLCTYEIIMSNIYTQIVIQPISNGFISFFVKYILYFMFKGYLNLTLYNTSYLKNKRKHFLLKVFENVRILKK